MCKCKTNVLRSFRPTHIKHHKKTTINMRVSLIGKRLRQIPIPKPRFCEHISADNEQSLSCRQRIYVTCPHCQRSLCLDHINEHQTIIRNVLDSLVNRLNEYQYELTVTLVIPSSSQTTVDGCLNEFRNSVIPYIQRTCCQNDVKQEDINRVQVFADKMSTIVQHVRFYWDNNNNSNESKSAFKRPRIDKS